MSARETYAGVVWVTGIIATICFLFGFQSGLLLEQFRRSITNGYDVFDAIRPGAITVAFTILLIASFSAGLGWLAGPAAKVILGRLLAPLLFSTLIAPSSGYLLALFWLHCDTAWLMAVMVLGQIVLASMMEFSGSPKRTRRDRNGVLQEIISPWIDRSRNLLVVCAVMMIIAGNLMGIWLSQGAAEALLAVSGVVFIILADIGVNACLLSRKNEARPVQK